MGTRFVQHCFLPAVPWTGTLKRSKMDALSANRFRRNPPGISKQHVWDKCKHNQGKKEKLYGSI
ncbi:MAG: hypothetical protein GX126_16240 [Bacteroidales bacterium]|nr:hypothetical protein [Bacteroidales bacterium]